MDIGRAAAMVISERIGRSPTFLIGKDTRISSDMLEAAISAGLCSVGASAIQVGVMPTPAICYLVTQEHAEAGIMLSASHNSYEYNGIKVFGHEGYKFTDSEERDIEDIVLDKVKPYPLRWGWELGRMKQADLSELYIEHLVKSVEGDLSGLRIAVDCSNGSASTTASRLFAALGAEVTILNDEPNGININRDCGSTHIAALSEYVAEEGCFDAGVAFDGDADRLIAVDEKGGVVDGDVIMAILAAHMKRKGTLHKNTLVATVMSNIGLFKFAEENGIHVETTKVGDRYVLERMRKKGYNLGGEESGHVILADHLMTGDGQLTAIQLLTALKQSGKPFSELRKIMTVYPKELRGFRADPVMKAALAVDVGAAAIIKAAEEQLGSNGRILVRASGTEPLIRVLIESRDEEQMKSLLDTVCEQLEERLSQNESCKTMDGI
jgi:phosphoglucosamine mutase